MSAQDKVRMTCIGPKGIILAIVKSAARGKTVIMLIFFTPSQDEVVESPDVHFDPIVKLAPVETKTLEEDEEEVFKMYVHSCLHNY